MTGPRTDLDPVCGMTVDPERSPHALEHAGTRYAFCSAGCVERFRKDPASFLRAPVATEAPAEPLVPGAVYTCPMHPEIRRDAPGACPKCGMALEPLVPTGAPDPELASMRRRFRVVLALTVPLFALA